MQMVAGETMNCSDRFRATMAYGSPDRVPYFEEGIREDVIDAWREQGLSSESELRQLFPYDQRLELEPDLDPIPAFSRWPETMADLDQLQRRLAAHDPNRLPADWNRLLENPRPNDRLLMLRVHRGFFLSFGVRDWSRFLFVMNALMREPAFVRRYMKIYGAFSARLADRILSDLSVDAAIFTEPIGGNDRPLISPAMYERFVLFSYEPVLEVLHRHGIQTIILRTYANARILVPSLLRWGFNCLWACEVNSAVMDYPGLRREFGRDLRLIGGIDLDALRHGKTAIRREIADKVAPLVADGGYVPLADGRVRADVPYAHYLYYRQLLHSLSAKSDT